MNLVGVIVAIGIVLGLLVLAVDGPLIAEWLRSLVRRYLLWRHPRAGCMLKPSLGWPPRKYGLPRPSLRKRLRYYLARGVWLVEGRLWRWAGVEAERRELLRRAYSPYEV